MNISVVLPILNEGAIIHKTVSSLASQLTRNSVQFEILAINDGSTDNTKQVLEKLQKKDKRIRLINHKGNKGYGAALQTGVEKARYDWIFFMDSDLQFDISEIKKFIPHTKTYDFIIGYRVDRADPLKRIYISKIYNFVVSFLFNIHLTDIDCAFKLMKKSSIKQLGELPNSFFVSTTLLVKGLRNNVKILELPVTHLPRTQGVSTVTMKQVLRTIRDLFIMYYKMNLKPFLKNSKRFTLGVTK